MANEAGKYKRVLGKQLADYVDNQVVILGTITKVSANGNAVELQTTDDVVINVNLPEPINGIAEGHIEIYGKALSKSTVSCNSYLIFPPEQSQNFDKERYNSLLATLRIIDNKKWKINAEADAL